jgi:hypothetical protein
MFNIIPVGVGHYLPPPTKDNKDSSEDPLPLPYPYHGLLHQPTLTKD